ncbi:FtsJ-like methyltransferase-domain-containing protein [Haematococcus lacustris]
MGGKTKKGKGRLDKYYHLAKEQGYRSRAAFKLIQLNRKYNFLGSCRALLDLCAAPGGWLQVAAKNMPLASIIIGVDLVPIKPIRGVKTLIGDITTQETRSALKKEAGGNMFDVVVHDGAPNIGGAWSNEAYTQAALVLDSLKLATEFLVPQGTFITKVFRSKDYNALLYAFNQLFTKVDSTKPTASRNTSAEIFVVCTGYKAPAKIDPRLLDPRHLFAEVSEVKKVMGPDALMKQKIKQVRHREGYEEGLSTSHKVASAVAFLITDTPVEVLGKVTRIALEGPDSWAPLPDASSAALPEGADLKELADAVRRSAATTLEVRALCGDLQVLGRTEFKSLLRWRLAVRKELKSSFGLSGGKDALLGKAGKNVKAVKATAGQKDEDTEAGAEEADPEAALLAEMAAVRDAMEARQRREKKKSREAKRKARVRAAQLGLGQGALEDNGPEGLFSLASALKASDSAALNKVVEVSAPGDEDMERLGAPDSSDDEYQGLEHTGGGEADSDEDSLAYEAQLEAALERSYTQFLERKGQREDALQEKRRRLGMVGELDDTEGEEAAEGEEGADKPAARTRQDLTGASGSDADDESEEGSEEDSEAGSDLGVTRAAATKGTKRGERQAAQEQQRRLAKLGAKKDLGGGGLLVQLDESRAGVACTGAAMAAQWFGQDLFDDPDLLAAEDEEEDEDEEAAGLASRKSTIKSAKSQAATAQPKTANGSASAAEPKSDSNEDEGGVGGKPAAAGVLGKRKSASSNKQRDGFEVVPPSKSRKTSGGARRGDANGESGSGSSDSDSEDEFDLLDDQGKAEVLALAKRMLRRKDKETIVDAAYNRYAFHDSGLPRWFAEDERRHMRPILPVTKEEVAEEKARLRAVDARPIKKVAEAKARQHKKMQGKLAQAREKAEAVAAQEDVPLGSKMREIEKLYARARSTAKKGKGGKGGPRGKSRGPPLDKRMLKDKRADKSNAKKAKKGGRSGGAKRKAGGSGKGGRGPAGGSGKGGRGTAGGSGKGGSGKGGSGKGRR